MDSLIAACVDYKTVSIIMLLSLIGGMGLGLSLKSLLPSIAKIFKRTGDVNIAVGSEQIEREHDHGPGGYCIICPEHEGIKKFLCDMKNQQVKNMETIIELRIVQESKLSVLTEVSKQQSKMWEKLEKIPEEFGNVKGQLGEIKGMLRSQSRA